MGQLARGSSLCWWRKEVQWCILYNSCWVYTCFVMYCAIVTFAFRKGTHDAVCATRRKELFMLVKDALQYDIPFCTTRVGRTLASLMLCAIVAFSFTTLLSSRGLIMRFVQLARGSSLHWGRKCCKMTFCSVQLTFGTPLHLYIFHHCDLSDAPL